MTVLLDGKSTTYLERPRYEGANIRTWIGFKHFMYLVEEAVLQNFAGRAQGAHILYHRYGLGLEIIDSSAQLSSALEVDDEVMVTVTAGATDRPVSGQGAPFTVRITAQRHGQEVTALKGKVRVALVSEEKDPEREREPVPDDLAPFVVPAVDALTPPGAVATPLVVSEGRSVADVLAPAGSNAFLWSWRIPYFYCHFSDRMQHSAYVRALEEVVDRFLFDRGLSIRSMMTERGWIPVVSRVRVRMLADAHMEEEIYTVFQVEEILKDISYTARMDCYVSRGDRLVHTATATIMHGYAVSRGKDAGTVAVLDERTQAALLGSH
jgi:acyl-CoA thioesterase FadM